MSYWARSPMPRDQLVLFSTTLDDRIAPDHPVRVYAELLDGVDWSVWEAQYHGRQGQPPIHPKVLAGVWLYALWRGIRSSRKVEYMVQHSVDFLWLASGHTPDHSTLSSFRTKFAGPLKQLHKDIVGVALEAGLAKLVDMGLDGTRVLAGNSRYATWTAASIARAIAELSAEFARLLEESRLSDTHDDGYGSDPGALPPELAGLDVRRRKLAEVQERLAEADAVRKKEGVKSPAQIPKHDPDAKVLPNKTGGYAPNYTPMVAVEGHGGFILDADVIVGNEQDALLSTVDRIAEDFGTPENVLADGAYPTGTNIEGMQQRGVAFFSHVPTPAGENPAVRPDPTQPVPEEQWDRLPVNPQTKKLDKASFRYDAAADTYYCPMGQPLTFERTNPDYAGGEKREWDIYRCAACAGCPLAGRCVSNQSKGGRTVRRDQHTEVRENFSAAMQTEAAREKYDERMRIAETPFGLIKGVLGLRQFLLRGLENVKTEFRWACTAVNLNKLVRGMIRLRAEAAPAAAAESTPRGTS
jgi:transposase